MPSRFFVFVSPPVAAPGLELREGLNILSENGFALLQKLAPDSFLLDHIEAEDGSRIQRSDLPAPLPIAADAGELVPDAGEPVSAAADGEGEAEGEALGEAEGEAEGEGPAIGPDAVTPAAGIKRPRARKS